MNAEEIGWTQIGMVEVDQRGGGKKGTRENRGDNRYHRKGAKSSKEENTIIGRMIYKIMCIFIMLSL